MISSISNGVGSEGSLVITSVSRYLVLSVTSGVFISIEELTSSNSGLDGYCSSELLTPPGHLISTPVLSGVRITQSLVLCVVFCRSSFNLRILITPLVS